MKTNGRRFSEPVSAVVSKDMKKELVKRCLESQKTMGEWFREAVEEKLQRERK